MYSTDKKDMTLPKKNLSRINFFVFFFCFIDYTNQSPIQSSDFSQVKLKDFFYGIAFFASRTRKVRLSLSRLTSSCKKKTKNCAILTTIWILHSGTGKNGQFSRKKTHSG